MEINDAEKLLAGTQYESFVGTLNVITLQNYVYDNHFKMGNDKLGYFSIKIRKTEEKNTKASINSLKEMNDIENYINNIIGIIEKDGYTLLVSEWVDGIQPIDIKRDTLPVFFAKLATFNKNNPTKGPFTSMYADGRYFNSVSEMIDWETNQHKKYFSEKLDTEAILSVMESLKKGIPCIINEDMNCGNFIVANDGKCKIIDTEWIIKGSNLYQFQHFDYFGFGGKKWYNITEEAEDCYRAYFEALGTSNVEANGQIKAIELLNILRENTQWKFSGNGDDNEIERRVGTILGKENYLSFT